MRRVYGKKVTRITLGDLPYCTGRNPGQGRLATGGLQVPQKSAEAIGAGVTDRQRAEHVETDRSSRFR
jgi:hypothetical protein